MHLNVAVTLPSLTLLTSGFCMSFMDSYLVSVASVKLEEMDREEATEHKAREEQVPSGT